LSMAERYVLKPPTVTRVGAKKTGWINFDDICTTMNRPPEHVSAYVLAETNTDGTFTGEGQFILKGRFYQRSVEHMLRNYVKEYVICKVCKSPKTDMEKDQSTRLHKIICRNCGADRSCAPIKTGYHAMGKGERKKEKLKNDQYQVRG